MNIHCLTAVPSQVMTYLLSFLKLFLPVEKEALKVPRNGESRPRTKFSTASVDEKVVFLDPHVLTEPGAQQPSPW